MKRKLEESRVILAGATGVVGREIGRGLVTADALLVLFARDRDRLDVLDLPGARVVGNVADGRACQDAVDAARSVFGCFDGVVKAAGVVAFGDLESFPDSIFDELLTTNLIGPVHLARAALPALGEGRPIAHLSAFVAERPMPGMAFYSEAKAALSAFDEALAKEPPRRGIDVIDLRRLHTETGFAERPLCGDAPKPPHSLNPRRVAERALRAVQDRQREVASTTF